MLGAAICMIQVWDFFLLRFSINFEFLVIFSKSETATLYSPGPKAISYLTAGFYYFDRLMYYCVRWLMCPLSLTKYEPSSLIPAWAALVLSKSDLHTLYCPGPITINYFFIRVLPGLSYWIDEKDESRFIGKLNGPIFRDIYYLIFSWLYSPGPSFIL